MRTKVTLVLLFLNVALFFFIFKFERSWRTERASLEARRRVLGAEAADIRTLTVTSTADGGSFSLTRRAEGWFLTAPLEWPANPHAVSRILSDLQLLENDASFTVVDLKNNGQSLADFGLDHPRLTLEFTGGSDVAPKPITLLLGDTTKIGNRLYLLSADGTRIHVVPRALADSLSLPLDQLRIDTLLTIPVFEARSLSLQAAGADQNRGAGVRVRLHKDGARWTFETPILARASKEAAELALSALGNLRAKTFVTAAPSATLPSVAPLLRVTVEGNNRRETLLLGEPLLSPPIATTAPASLDYYAQLEGRTALFTVTVPSDLLKTLREAQETLRETRILDFDARAVTSITLTAPNERPLTLQRDPVANSPDSAPWQLIVRDENAQAPQALPADRAAVQRLLGQLSLLTADKFASDAPSATDLENWGFNRPEREVTLSLAPLTPVGSRSGNSLPDSQLVLQLGLPIRRDRSAYARLAGTASVYTVSAEILRELPVTARAWRERVVRELPASARFVTIKLTDLTNNEILLDATLDPSGNPKPDALHAKSISALATALRSIRAKSFPQDGFTEKVFLGSEERPWRYRLDVTLLLPGGAGEKTSENVLFFTDRFGGTQQFAGSTALNTVFELEQPFVDALWTLTYGPRDPGPIAAPVPATK